MAERATRPELLAPAGDEESFLAAIAAGADAVYLGLKNFSARMAAENFGLVQLGRLADLARSRNVSVHVAMNTLIKPEELEQAWRLARRVAEYGLADGLIIQDLAMLEIARQAGFKGVLTLSTLANATAAQGLQMARQLGVARVVLPRELNLEELRSLAMSCPPGLGLECFVHGALCYCVSGRCYWSSYMGGRSGLRGRCVQPCRRLYERDRPKAKPRRETGQLHGRRLFSCQDLDLSTLVNELLSLPQIASWKIEGRKKGPHYVFHAVTAYRMLLDNPQDSRTRKTAREILDLALGRPGVRANFAKASLPPMAADGQTSSGLLAGKIQSMPDGSCHFRPYFDLQAKDLLRIGVEDERWHSTLPVTRNAPKGKPFQLHVQKHKTPGTGTPVWLVDRRDPELQQLLTKLKAELAKIPDRPAGEARGELKMPQSARQPRLPDIRLGISASPQTRKGVKTAHGLWLSPSNIDSISCNNSIWLPPVIWPEDEAAWQEAVNRLWRRGCRHFVCNTPWQRFFFPANLTEDARLLAGPFCNITNALALEILGRAGFYAAIVSPELAKKDILKMPEQSPLPLGFVLQGFWPVGVSRFGLEGLEVNDVFASPRGERFWSRKRNGLIWIYPAWPLDFSEKRQELLDSGYSFFTFIDEKIPKGASIQKRPGLFNWDGALL